jgi:hypothetical protein
MSPFKALHTLTLLLAGVKKHSIYLTYLQATTVLSSALDGQ